jgi:hypothetical protein
MAFWALPVIADTAVTEKFLTVVAHREYDCPVFRVRKSDGITCRIN